MKTLRIATLIAFAISCLISFASAYSDSSSHRRVLQSSIKTLTFYDGELTQGRRTQPVPQLSCVGKACKQYRPDVVQCTSMGDGEWKCSADLPHSIRMGRVEVGCEGWDHSSDPYILKGSCGLEYTLLKSFDDGQSQSYQSTSSGNDRFVSYLFKLFFWGVLLFILFSFFRSWMNGPRTTPPPGGPRGPGGFGPGGGWGSGWGGSPDSGDAPPPYDKSQSQVPPQAQTQGTGIWGHVRNGLAHGAGQAAAGAAVDSFLGRRRGGYERDWANDRGGMFGSTRTGGRYGNGSSGSSSSFGSGELRSSTGFGGTRNR